MFQLLRRMIDYIVEYLSMILLVLMTLIVTYVVFSRYLVSKTPSWGEESALLCMVWFGFISMAIGVRDNLHISIDIFDRILPNSFKIATDWIKRMFTLAFAVFMVVEGLHMSEVAGGNYMPGVGLPSTVLYAVVPLAGIVIIYYVLTDIVAQITKLKEAKR